MNKLCPAELHILLNQASYTVMDWYHDIERRQKECKIPLSPTEIVKLVEIAQRDMHDSIMMKIADRVCEKLDAVIASLETQNGCDDDETTEDVFP